MRKGMKRSTTARDRRSFSEEVKTEAVRRLHERRMAGGTLASVAPELDVGQNLLRGGAQRLTTSRQRPAQARSRRRSRSCGGCGWGTRSSRKRARSLKKSRCTSRRSRGEIRLYCPSSGRVCGATHVSGARRLARRVLCVADAVALGASNRRRAAAVERPCGACGERRDLRRARIQRELADQGIHVGTKRVARLMRDDGLAARRPTRGGVRTTDSSHAYAIAPRASSPRWSMS